MDQTALEAGKHFHSFLSDIVSLRELLAGDEKSVAGLAKCVVRLEIFEVLR
jgi:hypothetical protein